MIVSYDFRNHKPVIFTKHAAQSDPRMNVDISDAAQASSAAPIYFDPKDMSKYGLSNALIDGGVIANSPAFYSYLHVKYTKQSKLPIRVISIGTGEKQPETISSQSINKMTWVTEIPALITTVEQNTHDYLMRELLVSDYHRW